MTDSTIDGKYLCFIDRWPEGNVVHAIPLDGFNGDAHHNVASPAYPLGTKCRVYDDNALSKGQAGPATFMYGRMGTANATTAVAAKSIMVPGHNDEVYRVTNDYDTAGLISTGSPLCAVAIGAMTTQYYGWFLVGGIVPANLVTSGSSYVLDGNFKTQTGNLVAGPMITMGKTSGEIKLGPVSAGTGGQTVCGFTGNADA